MKIPDSRKYAFIACLFSNAIGLSASALRRPFSEP